MVRATKPIRRWEVIRDATSFILGWGLVFQQAVLIPPGDVNEAFLIFSANLILSPGILQAYASRKSPNGIEGQLLPQVRHQSRSRRSSSLSDTGDNDDA